MDPDLTRRLELKQMSNHELSQRYDIELVLRLNNPKNLRDTRNRLAEFEEYLDGHPPLPDLAKAFLTRYAEKKPRTRYRYTQMIQAFMRWYGQPIDDVKVRDSKYNKDRDIPLDRTLARNLSDLTCDSQAWKVADLSLTVKLII